MVTTYQRGDKRLSKVKPRHGNYALYVLEEKHLDALGNPAWTTNKSVSEDPGGINEERVVLWLSKQLIDLTERYKIARRIIIDTLDENFYEDTTQMFREHQRIRSDVTDGSTI